MLECTHRVFVYIAILAWLGQFFPVISIRLNFDLQWLETKPGNMLFKETYSVSLEM